MILFKKENIKNKSLDQNPLRKNKPIRLKILKNKIKKLKLLLFLFFRNSRTSWELLEECKILPTEINNILLKKACEKRWKIIKVYFIFEIIKNKNPTCERVLNATIFLKSISKIALNPLINIVNKLKIKINIIIFLLIK